jgi:hypothetical protein
MVADLPEPYKFDALATIMVTVVEVTREAAARTGQARGLVPVVLGAAAMSFSVGAAVGLTFSAMPNVIVESAAADQTGVATGMNANLRTIGGALGGQVTASIVTSGRRVLGYPGPGGYTVSLVIMWPCPSRPRWWPRRCP